MSILGTLGLSSSDADRNAALAKAAALKANKQAQNVVGDQYGTSTKAIKKGYAQARTDLAPALTNIGDIYAGEKSGYDVAGGLLGLPGYDQTAAAKAYADYQAPINEFGYQDLLRYGANTGTLAGGSTLNDLFNYANVTRFQPYLNTLLSNYDPLAANAQNLQAREFQAGQSADQGTKLADLSTGYGTSAANLFNQAGATNAGYFDKLAANQGQVGQNILGLAGNILGAGATLAGMRVPGGGSTALPKYASLGNNPMSQFGWGGA